MLDEVWLFQGLQAGMTPYVALYQQIGSSLQWVIHWSVFNFLGPDELLMRLPEAFEGILAIAAVYTLGRTLFNQRVGLISAFLLAISPFHLQFSTFVRFYALSALLAILTLQCLYQAIEKGGWGRWTGFTLLTAVNIANHPTALLVLACEGTYWGIMSLRQTLLLFRGKEQRRVWKLLVKWLPLPLSASASLGAQLIFSPLPLIIANSLFIALFGVAPFNTSRWALIAGTGSEGGVGGARLSLPFFANLVSDFVGGGGITVWVYGLVFALGIFTLLGTSRWKQLLLATLWFGLPFAMLHIVEIATFFKSRYFIFMLPLFLVIVAVGIDLLGAWIGQCAVRLNKNALFLRSLARTNLIFITTALLLFGGVGMKPLGEVVTPQLPDWRGVSRFLKTRALPGDTIFLLPYTADYQSFTYYYKPLEENTVVISLEWDLVSQLKTLPTRSIWWVVPALDVDPVKWEQAGFSLDSFDGLIVLRQPESASFEKLMDKAALILDYAVKQDIESNLNYGTFRSRALLNSALASICYTRAPNAECGAYFQAALDQFIAFRELAGGVTSIGVNDAWDFKALNRLALRINQAEALESLYNQWAQEWPDRQGPHRLLAEWYIAKGQLEVAVSEYNLAIAVGKGTTTGDHMALAQVYETLGETDQAIATYRQQFELYGVKRIEVARALFRLYKSQGIPYDQRIKIYEEALKKLFFDVEVYRDLGYIYLESGNWLRAEPLFRRAAWMNPSLAWPHRGLGNLYLKQGFVEKAILEFKQAIEKEPFRPGAYAELASWYETQADNQKALQVYELAIQDNPDFAWPHLALGDFYMREGSLQKAIAAYQKAIEIEPWNQGALDSLHNMQWNLASNLATLDAYTTNYTSLTWWVNGAWVRPYPDAPDTLVGRSALSVGGLVRSDQVHLHPFGPQKDTSIRFKVTNSMYAALEIGYGLADQAAGLSNGVRYIAQISLDNGGSYMPLFNKTITDSVWLSQTISLIPYLGEDVTFKLTVDALGNDSYDWLQTSVRLAPVVSAWDLSAHLDTVRATNMDWNGSNAWIDKNGRPLITVSQTPVQGMARENQVQFHPFSTQQESYIIFDVKDNPYMALKTRYALADESMGRSNGVDYSILISTDGGQSYSNLLKRQVLQNSWEATTLDLSAYLSHDLKFLLLASSRGDETYDWLQITLDFISHEITRANGF